MKKDLNQIIGAIMFVGGAAVFMIAAFMNVQSGSVPAAAFLIIIIAIGCYFPELFQDGSSAPSTLRICVLMVVAVFSVIMVKVGWEIHDLSKFDASDSWIYILGLAFGAKVTQSFAEFMSGRLGKKGSTLPPASSAPPAGTSTKSSVNGGAANYASHFERNALAGNADDYDV
jgi:hypothetical protein